MKSSLSNKKTINKYMEAVNKIIKNSNKQAIKLGIFHLQNHLTRQIQARAIEQVIIGDEWEKEEWLLTCIYKMPHEYIKSGTDIKVNISSFPCVSFVASKTRLINCFKWIGYPVNPFLQGTNHSPIYYLYPLNVIYCSNGMHSFSTGTLESNSYIRTDKIINLKNSYSSIYFDGKYFRKIDTNKKLFKAPSLEFGILYEIGRFVLKLDIHWFDF
ncbi:DUF6710 family protein [uncultured Enterococcus sp.]|uniref:DUF6710 family protein n=1 Tax=uncultured Enterococcus sp. TaxID=167972 RepID=UPI00261620FC|nr:DUF6710 family protein [uncultured Enterococcus sp.]